MYKVIDVLICLYLTNDSISSIWDKTNWIDLLV